MSDCPQRRAEDKLNQNPRPIPDNDQEKIHQMWYMLIGPNGSGLIEQFKELKDHVEDKIVTKEVCAAIQGNKSKKTQKYERIIFITLGVLAFIFGDNIISALIKIGGL